MPLTAYELAKTFFPGCRKANILKQVTLLQTKADEKRLKMLMAMPLGDGKQVGMPSWIGESYDVMAREGSTLGFQKWTHDITEMTMTIFPTDDAKRPSMAVVCPKITSFSLRRGGEDTDESLAEVYLQFEVYANDSVELWNWSRTHHRGTAYCLFETTQMELKMAPTQDPQLKLGSDEYEAERREATSKAHDEEFAQVAQA